MSSENKREVRRRAPMVFPVIGYLLGIVTIHVLNKCGVLPSFIFMRLNTILLILVSLCVGLFLWLYLLPRYTSLRFSTAHYLCGIAALFCTGAWSYSLQNNLTALPQNSEPTAFYGQVERVTRTRSERFMRVNTRLLAFRQKEKEYPCNRKSFLYIPIHRYDANIQVGSKIWTVSKIQSLTQDSSYQSSSSMPPSIFIAQTDPLGFTHSQPSFPKLLSQKLLAHLKANISDSNAFALLAGLSLGNKEAFDPELRSAYTTSGAAHILAVSGLHVGIIYAIILFLCNLLLPGNHRRQQVIKQILIVSAITLFAALAGFTPSVTRALLMVALSAFGKLIRRPVHSFQTLFTTAFIICVINPAALFEVGFQLSFSAVFAILFVLPYLEPLLKPKTKFGKYVWSMICVSTSAQIGTAWLAYHYFGVFPYLSLVTNLFVIPLTGVLLYVLCLWLMLGFVPVIGPLLLWSMEQTARMMNIGVVWMEKISASPVAIPIFVTFGAAFLFLLLTNYGRFFWHNFKNKLLHRAFLWDRLSFAPWNQARRHGYG